MNDDKDVFVSRHGRRTSLNTVNLGDMQIDEQPKPVSKKAVPAPPKKQLVFPRPKRKPLSRKAWIAIGATILVLIFVPLLTLEVVALQYNRNATTIQTEVARIAKNVALPEQKKSQLASGAIDMTLTQLSSVRDRSCKGGMLDNIAKLYPRAASALQNCTTANGQLSELVNSLSTLRSIQTYSATIEATLKPALAASNSPYAVIPDQVATWQTAAGKLKDIDAPNELKTFHASLEQVVGDIATQWSAMNLANNAQNTDGFKDSESKLGSFYESLRELSPMISSTQLSVQAQVSKQASDILP